MGRVVVWAAEHAKHADQEVQEDGCTAEQRFVHLVKIEINKVIVQAGLSSFELCLEPMHLFLVGCHLHVLLLLADVLAHLFAFEFVSNSAVAIEGSEGELHELRNK